MANGPLGPTDVRMTVYDSTASNVLVLDAVEKAQDFGGGQIQYEDTPAGCGAATLTLGLRYEDVINRGYYQAFNIIEISTGDMLVTTSFASGASKVYVNSNAGFSSAYSPENGLAYFWDGATLTMRVPVTGTGSDGGGQFVTIGSPLGGGVVPAYTAGATIMGRRRYAGRIVRVPRPNQKEPKATITCVGLNATFDQAVDSFTYTSQDVGAAIYQTLLHFAARWSHLTISAGNFPNTGSLYSGTGTNTTVASTISNALSGIVNGDLWVVRVGHDRTARLLKLFTASSGIYAFPIALPQGVDAFEPQNVLSEDEDASNMFNAVYVIGDTQPGTKQPFVATVTDSSSVALYGQVDKVVTNLQCKSTQACLTYGTALLKSSSLAIANDSCRIYTHSDNRNPLNQPAGLTQGDVVCGVSCPTISRFSGTGSVVNMVPDSAIAYPPSFGADALWTVVGSMLPILGAGPGATNVFRYVGTGSASGGGQYAYCQYIDVVPGQVLTVSCYVNASHVTSIAGGAPGLEISNLALSANYGFAAQAVGVSGTVSAKITIPGGVTQIVAVFTTNNCTVASGQNLDFGTPQVQAGSSATTYVPNYGAPNLFGLISSAQTTLDPNNGDSWQDIKFEAIQPDWSAAIAERTNTLSTALVSNAALGVGLDQYFVSPGAWPQPNGPASSGLVVTPPVFQAVFALNTPPVYVAATQSPTGTPISFTLVANTTNWVWLNTPGSYNPVTAPTYSVSQVPINPNSASPLYPTSILYGIFQTNATSVIGATSKATVGSLGMPMGYLLNNGGTYTPTYTLTTAPFVLVSGPISSMIETAITITNQPTDGSLSKVHLWYKQTTQTAWVQFAATPVNNAAGSPQNTAGPFSATGLYTWLLPEITNGNSYDFGLSVESGASGETTIINFYTLNLLATIATNPIAAPYSGGPTFAVAGSSLPPYATNLLNDSNFQYSPFNTSTLIAASSTYWTYQLIDGISFGIKQGSPSGAGDGANYWFWTPGANGSNRYGYSNPVAVVPGQTYVASAYFDARSVSAGGRPFLGIYNFTGGVIGAALQTVVIAPGTNGRIQVSYTVAGGVTQVVVFMSSNICTIVAGTPGVLIAMNPQLELAQGSIASASPYKATVGVNPDGSQSHGSMSRSTQSAISTAGNLTLTKLAGLPQDASGLMTAAPGAFGFTASTLYGSTGGNNILYTRVLLTANANVPNSISLAGRIFILNTTNSSPTLLNGYTMEFGTDGSGNFICAAWRWNSGTQVNIGGVITLPPVQFQTTHTFDVVWNYNAGTPKIQFLLDGSAIGTWIDSSGGSIPTGAYGGFYNNTPGVTFNLEYDVSTGTIPYNAHSPAVQAALGSDGSIIGIHGVLVAQNQTLSSGAISGSVSSYTWVNAFAIDLSALPSSESFFVEALIIAGPTSFSGTPPMMVSLSPISPGGGSSAFFETTGFLLPAIGGVVQFIPSAISFNALGGSAYNISIAVNSYGCTMSGSMTGKAIHVKATRYA